jgi:large-conductance mechanosensitive channel
MEVKLRERYIPPFIMLLAGAITSIVNIINKVDMLTGLKRLLLVIIIFYMIGLVARSVIKKANKRKPNKEEEQVQEEEAKPEENKK